jgi:hypothetical protein
MVYMDLVAAFSMVTTLPTTTTIPTSAPSTEKPSSGAANTSLTMFEVRLKSCPTTA